MSAHEPAPAPLAAVFGCGGLRLDSNERAFFRDANPWGLILFRRNVDSPEQIRALIADFRDALGRAAPVFIDQEGGRVARLGAPHWRVWPAPLDYGDAEAMRLRYALIGHELRALGIEINCVPLLDIPAPGAHDVIGDRALGRNTDAIIPRARAVLDGLMLAGCLGVIKHLPGHGRAEADSHKGLPVVDAPLAALEASDFRPFRAFRDAPMGMSAHIVYSVLDPQHCATQSPAIIRDIIRRHIGFDGLLLSDDLCMEALSGGPGARAMAALQAGCDIALHCNGDLAAMRAVALMIGPVSGDGLARLRRVEALRAPAPDLDIAAMEARLGALGHG